MKEEIKDNRHQRIGYVEKQLNGVVYVYDRFNSKIGTMKPEGNRLVAYDKYNNRMAYWDESWDATYDKYGKKLEKGNILLGMYFQ